MAGIEIGDILPVRKPLGQFTGIAQTAETVVDSILVSPHYFGIPAGRDWPLFGYDFGRMKFGNVPTDGQT